MSIFEQRREMGNVAEWGFIVHSILIKSQTAIEIVRLPPSEYKLAIHFGAIIMPPPLNRQMTCKSKVALMLDDGPGKSVDWIAYETGVERGWALAVHH